MQCGASRGPRYTCPPVDLHGVHRPTATPPLPGRGCCMHAVCGPRPGPVGPTARLRLRSAWQDLARHAQLAYTVVHISATYLPMPHWLGSTPLFILDCTTTLWCEFRLTAVFETPVNLPHVAWFVTRRLLPLAFTYKTFSRLPEPESKSPLNWAMT